MIDTTGKTFEQVAAEILKKLIEQGGRCTTNDYDGGPLCAYGDGKGRHCAIGWLLPEDDADLMEYEGDVIAMISEFDHEDLGSNAAFLETYERELRDLQSVHDIPGHDCKFRIATRHPSLKPLIEQWVHINGKRGVAKNE